MANDRGAVYVRDLDPTLIYKLEQLAEIHDISVNKMARSLLENCLKETIISDELSTMREMRDEIDSLKGTVQEFLTYNIELLNLVATSNEGVE